MAENYKRDIHANRNPEDGTFFNKSVDIKCVEPKPFNLITSSEIYQAGPGRFSKKERGITLIGSQKRENTYNEHRRCSLPYKKFITLEVCSTSQFALRFHKFYSEGIKNRIRNTKCAKFDTQNRAWIVGLRNYDLMVKELKHDCELNGIHIEEIPSFIMNIIFYKTPFQGPESQMHQHNYEQDDLVIQLGRLIVLE